MKTTVIVVNTHTHIQNRTTNAGNLGNTNQYTINNNHLLLRTLK